MPQTTANVSLDTRFFCLFKGDPGTGKSIAAASYPGKKDNPNIGPYFMDNDGRMKSVINYWRPRGREFEYDRFGSYIALNKQLEEFYNYGCPYYTIVYDGITTGGDQILSDMIDTRDAHAKKNVRAGIELLQIEDYGGESRGLSVIINNLKAISFRHGTNVIVTAHVLTSESTDLKTKVTTVSRTLLTAGKKVAAKLPVHFDECYHFDIQTGMSVGPDDKPKYSVITRNVGFDWAKTALPIPTRIEFTDGSLYDIIMGHLAGKEFVQPVNDPVAAASVATKETW
jgi:hypothetical protein